jgi:hypothetical protein
MKTIESIFPAAKIEKLIEGVYLITLSEKIKLIYRLSDEKKSSYFTSYSKFCDTKVISNGIKVFDYTLCLVHGNELVSFIDISIMTQSRQYKNLHYYNLNLNQYDFIGIQGENTTIIRPTDFKDCEGLIPFAKFYELKVRGASIYKLEDSFWGTEQYFCPQRMISSPWFHEEERINDEVSVLKFKRREFPGDTHINTYLFHKPSFLFFKVLEGVEILNNNYLILHENDTIKIIRLSDFARSRSIDNPHSIYFDEEKDLIICKTNSGKAWLNKDMELSYRFVR